MPELPSSLRGVTNWPKTICCSIRLILGIKFGTSLFTSQCKLSILPKSLGISFSSGSNRFEWPALLRQSKLMVSNIWVPHEDLPSSSTYSSSQQMLQQSMTISYSQLKVPWNLQAPYPPAAKLAQPALAQALFIPPKRSACLSWIHPWNAFQISPCIHHIYSEKFWKGKMTPGS